MRTYSATLLSDWSRAVTLLARLLKSKIITLFSGLFQAHHKVQSNMMGCRKNGTIFVSLDCQEVERLLLFDVQAKPDA